MTHRQKSLKQRMQTVLIFMTLEKTEIFQKQLHYGAQTKKTRQRDIVQHPPSQINNLYKFTLSKVFHSTAGSEVAQGTTPQYTRPRKDFKIKSVLQDQQLECMLKTANPSE